MTVLQNRLERRRVPQLERVRRLNVIMAVEQDRWPAVAMFVTRPNDWMTRRRNNFRFQSDLFQLLRDPGGAIANFIGKFCISRNAWKSQEGIIFLKIIVAHGRTLISFSLFAYDFRRLDAARKPPVTAPI